MSEQKYWIGVVSRDHVTIGVAQGFAQLNHGKAAPLQRMGAGDGLIFYSPRMEFPGGEPLQAFTAIGQIRTGTVYQATVSQDFQPFRIDVEYFPAQSAPIQPLIEPLSFIRSKKHWGAPFRFGVIRVPKMDFMLIAGAMAASLPDHFGALAPVGEPLRNSPTASR